VDELLWVEKLCGGDDEAAEKALEKLRPRLCRVLKGCLSDLHLCSDDIDDVIEETVLALWDRRCHLSFENLAYFWGYARRVARNNAFRRSSVIILDTEDDIPDGEFDLIDIFVLNSLDRQLIYEAADSLWLQDSSPRQVWERKLLAAQFLLLNQLSVEDVVAILGPYSTITAADIRAWLDELSTHLRLCYDELYWQNKRLAKHLMKKTEHWPESRRAVVMLRYGNGLPDDKILQMHPALSPQDLNEFKAECASLLPFVKVAPGLANACRPKEPLSEQGLWKRLAFQYAVCDELPHKHILERAGIPAEEVGVKLTAAMLNAWLSNGRIYSELGKHIKEAMAP
jgi:DNA-directed RNA polymerase specialized sigma24 family protein